MSVNVTINVVDEDEYLEEFWNDKHPNYNSGIVIEETAGVDECDFMDKLI